MRRTAAAQTANDPFLFANGGGRRIVNFTVTNFCNAKCVFCSFPAQKAPHWVPFEEARRAIDHMVSLDVGLVSLTGGEPLLNPDLPRIAAYAKSRGLVVISGTNGALLTREWAAALKAAGLDALWISYESDSPDRFDRNRGVPGLTEKIREGVQHMDAVGLNHFAIALINRAIEDVDALVRRLLELGFTTVKFDYPMSEPMSSTYLGWSDSPLLKYNAEEMEEIVNAILRVKEEGRIRVVNPVGGLEGAVDFYKDNPPKYPCYAGERILYLDTTLEYYRCPLLPERLGRVGGPVNLGRIPCNRCYYQGARDFGSFYYFLETVDLFASGRWWGDPLAAVRRADGRLLRAAADAMDLRRSGIQ